MNELVEDPLCNQLIVNKLTHMTVRFFSVITICVIFILKYFVAEPNSQIYSNTKIRVIKKFHYNIGIMSSSQIRSPWHPAILIVVNYVKHVICSYFDYVNNPNRIQTSTSDTLMYNMINY